MDLDCLPYGAGHAQEGVCLLVRMGPHRILLDCGVEDVSPLSAKLDRSLPADFVVCTHAHSDHARGLLALHQSFPHLPIYASEVTARLLPLNWPEQSQQPESRFCQGLPWQSSIELRPGLTVQLFPSGHLPGAATVLLTYTAPHRTYTLVYTGDFFLSNSRLVEGLPLGELRGMKPDVLILEGSYGTARHPHRRQLENQLADRIHRAIGDGYSVLLPSPAIGLGQELLMLLRSHHYFTGRDLDIWVDGTVADGCDTYLELLPQFPTAVQNFALHQPLFWDERVKPRVRRLSAEGRAGLGSTPCIVITDRIAHLNLYVADRTNPWILLAPQKPGYPLRDWLPNSAESGVRSLETYLLAEHCDGPGTTQLIHNLRPQHVIFVHGSPAYLADLANLDELRNRYQLHTPATGTIVELPIGEMFLQPAIPETNYEGELSELGTEVAISLPSPITADPRWANFADTGLVEARWQGEELVLRGISQRELLFQGSPVATNLECCGNCQHYRGQRCWNQSSPLFGFKVTPDGYCPVFESISESELFLDAETEGD
ncbi:MBL fold metallo-hydrolase [Tychonema sp. LEGE 07199]|uniref:MBL fold metallo-hydrolase n=1 Tax=unclassified Tychonema TaxID=2642144 RepID=UPI00187E9EEB|nr:MULTISPECIES: MBL fold metallo-hydrolase [unclassified Tychonema]MBE9123927.1 MBL fold metallo-hydrolase [Tychonema sp. LEGE 07199]MBE9131354.1 MBL fold metallo-hydrolase [Tychonema sp. LEGE 07196]